MKKFILGILLSAFCLTSFATPVFKLEQFIIANTGNVPIYYALPFTYREYGNTLCAEINGKTVKEEIKGKILPGISKSMSLLPVNNYLSLCSSSSISYYLAFGLTQDAAYYNENSVFIVMDFNDFPGYDTGTAPFQWFINGNTSKVFTSDIQPNGTLIIYLNSDSEQFVY